MQTTKFMSAKFQKCFNQAIFYYEFKGSVNSVDVVANFELPHLDPLCFQIQLFLFYGCKCYFDHQGRLP